MKSNIYIKETTEIPFVEFTENPFVTPPVYRSELVIGNITVRFTKKFNLFHRIMLRLVFGLNIKKVEV